MGHAVRRRTKVYAEWRATAFRGRVPRVAPGEDGDGAVRVMRRASQDAGIDPTAIDYVTPTGTSLRQGDAVETRALKTVFGDRARRVAVSSTSR